MISRLPFITGLARLETPLVAAVDGVAVGVGTTMLLASRLVYAAPTARVPPALRRSRARAGGCSSLLLPRRVGLVKASELLLLAEPFDADEGFWIGSSTRVVPADRLSGMALEQAKKLAAKPCEAIAATRRLMRGNQAKILAAMERE